ncbi:MAG: hypothetical protein ACR2JD_00155 [Nocardioides sp.]
MSTRAKSVVWLVLLVVLINLPLASSTLDRREVRRSGTDVTATLVEQEVLGDRDDPAYWLSYRLPESADPDQGAWAREVERDVYDAAVASGQVTVRVIDGEPATALAEGQVIGRAGLVATLVADLLILGFVLLLWRFGRYGRPEPLRLEAIGDVTTGAPGGAIDEDPSGVVVVRGALAEVTEHDVVLDTGDRRVIVVLDGHQVRADLGAPAQVPGRRLA